MHRSKPNNEFKNEDDFEDYPIFHDRSINSI